MAELELYNYVAHRVECSLRYVIPRASWNVLDYEHAGQLAETGGTENLYIYGMFEHDEKGITYSLIIPLAHLKVYDCFTQMVVKLACDFTRTCGGLNTKPLGIRTFIVLGCPRSGTSLTAGVLHHSGIEMGDKLAPAHEANPAGFYENLNIADLNSWILKTLGVEYLAPIPPGQIVGTTQCEMEIAAAIVYYARGDWGWKDPRTVVLWPLYERCLSEVFNPHLIITHRGYTELFRSWMQTGWTENREKTDELINFYVRRLFEIERDTGYPTLHVDFEDWWDALDGQVARLAEFTGHEIDAGHFDPNLRRANKGDL